MIGFLKRKFSKDRYYYNLIWDMLAIVPSNIELFKLALIHRSASVEIDGKLMNNERLEFLGDAVLETISSEMVFISNPDADEGELTRIRSRLVSRENLNILAKHLELDKAVHARPLSLIQTKSSMLGDAMEAIVGALYLDAGYNKTCDVVMRLMSSRQNIFQVVNTERDFKSRIIEWTQKEHLSFEFKTEPSPSFTAVDPNFTTELIVDGKVKGIGNGRNKKTSEQRAARQLYTVLVNEGKIEEE